MGDRLQLKMISEESVRRFGKALGVGKVYGPYGPYPSQLGRSAYFMWVAQHHEDMIQAATLLRPYVSPSLQAKLDALT